MKLLLDTNVLIRYENPTFAARQAVRREVGRGSIPVIVPQVLTEYWAVATRPLTVNGLGLTTLEATAEIDSFKRQFELIYDSQSCYLEWEGIVRRHEVKGKHSHDAKLVAAMLAHGIPAILTFDADDFKRFDTIQILMP